MADTIDRRIKAVQALANYDSVYSDMLEQLRSMERKYDAVLQKLPPEDQDAVCDFVSQCEAMSCRLLELACSRMIFPQENTPDQ